MRKLTFCKCENMDADQMRAHRTADWLVLFLFSLHVQLFYFLNPKFQVMAARPVYVGVEEVGFLVTLLVCQPCDFSPLNIDYAKLRNTGLNRLVVNWSFFHNLCQNCFSLSLFYATKYTLYTYRMF